MWCVSASISDALIGERRVLANPGTASIFDAILSLSDCPIPACP
jgi:hypothetical protein